MNYAIYGFIALGGALGALGRYLLSTWLHGKGGYIFPWGTFTVNILGCFILGLVYVWGTDKFALSSNMMAFMTVGFLGAFTTFSTFSLETINIITDGELRIALLYTGGSIVAGLLALWLGTLFAELLVK